MPSLSGLPESGEDEDSDEAIRRVYEAPTNINPLYQFHKYSYPPQNPTPLSVRPTPERSAFHPSQPNNITLYTSKMHANFQFETPHNSNAEHLGNSESKLPTGGRGQIFHIFSFAINAIMYIYMHIGGQETKLAEDTLIMKRNNPQKDIAALSLLLVIGPVATFSFPTGKTNIPTWKSFLFLEAGEICKLLQRKDAN
ncbi:hypothetical protein O181_066823 [Austropuccinia psidii MF-1]|uniref:Uncharacterized protein n=1 Tax=Austropuccinia psidii MF-1 TaxID=1389203 RepID=A0A9Q3I3Y5_9BASI|nr:hypothetical protein [Austropuccinia psidii MF-1]